MAVINTPQGRVIGLIVPSEDQPKPQPKEEAAAQPEPKVVAPPKPSKRPGRPVRK